MSDLNVFSIEDMERVVSTWIRYSLGTLILIQNRLAEIEVIDTDLTNGLDNINKAISDQLEWLTGMLSEENNQAPIIHNAGKEFAKLGIYLEEKVNAIPKTEDQYGGA